MSNISVRQWQIEFAKGAFDEADKGTQIKAGWFDWFCKSSSLRNKTLKMGKIISRLKPGGKVDFDNWYVWFKNNCPMVGPLYDDFRFASSDTGDVQFTICIDDKRGKAKYEVYGIKNDFEEPLACFGDSRELAKWLNEPWEE